MHITRKVIFFLAIVSQSIAFSSRTETNDRLNADIILADGCRERAEVVIRTGMIVPM